MTQRQLVRDLNVFSALMACIGLLMCVYTMGMNSQRGSSPPVEVAGGANGSKR